MFFDGDHATLFRRAFKSYQTLGGNWLLLSITSGFIGPLALIVS